MVNPLELYSKLTNLEVKEIDLLPRLSWTVGPKDIFNFFYVYFMYVLWIMNYD